MLSSWLHKNPRRLAPHLLGYWIVFVLLYACFQPCPRAQASAQMSDQAPTLSPAGQGGLIQIHGHEDNDHHSQALHHSHEGSAPHACTHAELPDITLSSARSNAVQSALGFLFKSPVLILTLSHFVRQSSATAFIFSAKDPLPPCRSIPVNTRLLI